MYGQPPSLPHIIIAPEPAPCPITQGLDAGIAQRLDAATPLPHRLIKFHQYSRFAERDTASAFPSSTVFGFAALPTLDPQQTGLHNQHLLPDPAVLGDFQHAVGPNHLVRREIYHACPLHGADVHEHVRTGPRRAG